MGPVEGQRTIMEVWLNNPSKNVLPFRQSFRDLKEDLKGLLLHQTEEVVCLKTAMHMYHTTPKEMTSLLRTCLK